MFYDGGHFMGGIHALWWIFWLVLIGALVFLAFRRAGRRDDMHGETPHEVLRRRLASGEVTAKEYEESKALLDRDVGGKR